MRRNDGGAEEDWRCLAEMESELQQRWIEDGRGCDTYDRWLSNSPQDEEAAARVVEASRSGRWPEFVSREAARLGIDLATSSGLLPSVECAWVALANTLVVWDYSTGEVASYENLSGSVVSCACGANALSSIFEDSVRAVLVVVTRTEVELVALAWRDGVLRLLPTELGAGIQDVEFSACVAGMDGRVFLSGSDGFVYEFDYATPTSWKSRLRSLLGDQQHATEFDDGKKRRRFTGFVELAPAKVCKRDPSRLRRLATLVIPAGLRRDWLMHPMQSLGLSPKVSERQRRVVALAIDDVRAALYAATTDCLECYDVSDGDCKNLGRSCRVFEAAKRWCERRAQHDSRAPDSPSSENALVAVHALSPFESYVVHVVCVDDKAYRYYFTTFDDRSLASFQQQQGNSDDRPKQQLNDLTLLFVKPPLVQATATMALSSYGLDTLSSRLDDSTDGLVFYGQNPAKPTAFVEQVDSEKKHHHTVCGMAETMDREGRNGKLRTLTALSARLPVSAGGGGVSDQVATGLSAPDTILLATVPTTAALDRPLLRRFWRFRSPQLAPTTKRKLALLTNGGSHPPLAIPENCSLVRDGIAETGGPLPELATQYLVGERRVAILTRAGVEEFAKLRPLDHFRDALSMGNLSASLESFGPQESCCMALYLACSSTEPSLKAAALLAFKSLGGRPTLELLLPNPPQKEAATPSSGFSFSFYGGGSSSSPARGGDATQDGSNTQERTGWFAADNANGISSPPVASSSWRTVATQSSPKCKFELSARCEALRSLVARLLRPVWLRPLVWYDSTRSRAEFLLDPIELGAIRDPILELVALLKDDDFFAAATSTDLLASGFYYPENTVSWETQSAAAREAEATRRETRLVHKLYRLVSRVGCALSLLDILRRARDAEDRARQQLKPSDDACRTVDREISKLGTLRLRELTCDAKTHDSVRDCLRFLTLPKLAVDGKPSTPQQYEWPDPLASALSELCYLYFNGGDALARSGAGHLEKAVDLEDRRRWAEAQAERDKARQDYLKAAEQWRSPRDAIGDSSALRTACDALRRGKCAAAAIGCALVCAKTFGPTPPPPPPAPTWELALYRHATTGGVSGGGGGYSGDSDDDIKAARDACYEAAIGVLRDELGTAGEIKLDPIDSATAALREACELGSKSEHPASFVEQIVRVAIDLDERRLLHVPVTGRVAACLESMDPWLLWRHHVHSNRDEEASALMERLAHDEKPADVAQRVGYLVRAVEAARRASTVPASKLSHLVETLELARLQQRCGVALSALADAASRYSVEDDAVALVADLRSASDKLSSTSLVSVSELYNDYCSKYDLWELCLAVMRATGQAGSKWSTVLWRSIVRRCVPLNLARLQEPSFWWGDERLVLDDELKHLRPVSAGVADAASRFEEDFDSWKSTLCDVVGRLSADLSLNDDSASLRAVVSIMQKVAAEHARLLPQPDDDEPLRNVPVWPLDTLLASVDELNVFEALAANAADAEDPFDKFLCVASAATLLNRWSLAAANDPTARPRFAAAERRGARPSELVALLDREFSEPESSPDLRALRKQLRQVTTRIDAIFSR